MIYELCNSRAICFRKKWLLSYIVEKWEMYIFLYRGAWRSLMWCGKKLSVANCRLGPWETYYAGPHIALRGGLHAGRVYSDSLISSKASNKHRRSLSLCVSSLNCDERDEFIGAWPRASYPAQPASPLTEPLRRGTIGAPTTQWIRRPKLLWSL